ncbi:hypothetical protein APHAL10511_000289 [Amanita phalloides]|nr:hypothetical protein APHAL10511_000289 [Amanita phalloides]
MSLLHACILLRDFKSFQRLLNTGAPVEAGCISEDDPLSLKDRQDSEGHVQPALAGWGSPPKRQHADDTRSVNVNERDPQGRTALHLACSLPDCVEYIRLLLKHPSINVNLQDLESHYTPLHRAMYVANLPVVLLLLQRPDIGTSIKDNEGYTAFDLYNSTVEGTNPDPSDPDALLFMWGANANATLGFADGNNRSHPDQIVIQPKDYISFPPPGPTLHDRFSPIHVRQVSMSKLHTVVVTSEPGDGNTQATGGGNLRLCGFGSSGRLGPSAYHHTQQYALSALPSHAFSPAVRIVRVAVGQDHTLALTKAGEVYTWGLNRFTQLGYVVRHLGDGAGPGISASCGGGSIGGWNNDGNGKALEGALDDMVQHTPRRVQDALRKEVVVGVAASKMASACWTTAGDLFTWGTNSGQLGYERSSQPQILPRKVSKLAHKVIDVALSDTAMACLLNTRDVICVWNDKEVKINFPTQTPLRPKNQPYRPPPRKRDAGIAKLTVCDDVFAALSLSGEVFIFAAPDSAGDSGNIGKTASIKPQRAWVLKKKYRAVKDVALGANGDIIVCTESGHVFVRTRNPVKAVSLASQTSEKGSGSGGGSAASGSLTISNMGGSYTGTGPAPGIQTNKIGSNFNFVRVPCLQRITQVCANSAGAFGALKVDLRHAPIEIVGNVIAEDLKEVMPFVAMYCDEDWRRAKKGGRYGLGLKRGSEQTTIMCPLPASADPDDGDMDDVKDDVIQLRRLCEVLGQEKKGRREEYPRDKRLPFDADVMVVSQSEAAFPAHRVILAGRSPVLRSVLEGKRVVKDEMTNITIRFVANKGKQMAVPVSSRPYPSISTCGKLMTSGCHALTILILLTYLYSDELLAAWDPRVKMELRDEYALVKVKPDQIRTELQVIARILELPLLSEALEPWLKRIPASSLARDMDKLWIDAQPDDGGWNSSQVGKYGGPLAPDVLLQLADREVWCHSVLLRARSDLFASFFGEEEWTVNRWSDNGVVTVNMRHLGWHVMYYVLKFMFSGEERVPFLRLDFINSVDDVLEFMFSVMSAATELLLDRLVLVCSSVILEHVNIQNACYILNDATHFNAKQLIERLQLYMVVNLETLLEQRMLDDVPHRLVKQLAVFARKKQAEKSPRSRTNALFDTLMQKYAEWLALQDFPEPILRLNRQEGRGVNVARKRSRLSLSAALMEPMSGVSTPSRAIRRPPSGEDIFIMDDGDGPSVMGDSPPGPSNKSGVWKPRSAPRVDMKSLMAEEAANIVSAKRPIQVRQTASRDSIATTPSPSSSLQRTSSAAWRISVGSPTMSTSKKLTPPASPPAASDSRRESLFGLSRSEAVDLSTRIQLAPKAPTSPSHRSQTTPESRSSGLGPIITPTRQPSKTSTSSDIPSIRRASGKAWTLPPVEPVIATSPPSSSMVTSISFVAIQQLELEQATTVPAKDKRSLRDIQAEEEARQQEEGFLRWWAAEEERVRLEVAAVSRALAESQGQASKQRRKSRGGKKADAPSSTPLQTTGGAGIAGEVSEHRGKPRKPPRPKKSEEPKS